MRVSSARGARRSSGGGASRPLTSTASSTPMSKSSWLAPAPRPSRLAPASSTARLRPATVILRHADPIAAARSSENDDSEVEFEVEREEVGPTPTPRTTTATTPPPPSPSSSAYTHLGPASLAALEALEWSKLCSYVARFASTSAGRDAARGGLELGATRERSLELASLTSAAAFMEGELGRELDFAGTSTSRARSAAQRAERGGMLLGSELVAVASLAAGSVRLSASVLAAASAAGEGDDARSAAEGLKWRKPPREGKKEKEPSGAETLRPLSAPASLLNRPPLRDLAAKLFSCLDDDGYVRDSASEALRAARVKLRTAEARARSAVKGRGGGGGDGGGGGGGSAAERGGRYCVALPDGAPPPRGAVLLGGGGGVRYWEPASLVPINNALAAARAEASAAEDDARWSLSALAADASADLEQAFEFVLASDLAAARARYGVWIDGAMASCHDLAEREDEARRGGRKRGGGGEKSGDDRSPPPSSCPFSVELRDLRQPLLLGAHLLARDAEAAAARRRRAAGVGGSGVGGVGGASGASAAAAANRASTAASAAAALAAAGVSSVSSTHFSSASPSSEQQQQREKKKKRVPQPPVPIDVLVPSRARVVVVTGPNTGGKTAALKSVGLCALCAAAGVPIPASPTSSPSSPSPTARMPWFSRVLCDIGDAQSLSASLSTFSGHLARVSAARAEAASARARAALERGGKFDRGDGDDALFLIDELGTGTDPREGAALGAALLRKLAGGDAEELVERKRANKRWNAGGVGLTLATTHHASLAALKAHDAAEMLRLKNERGDDGLALESRFENAAADFDVTSLSPTRKLLWGVPGKSAALDVAASLGLDAGVVAAARRRLAENTGLSALIEAGVVGSPSSGAPSSLDAAVADVEAARAAAARDRRLAAEARASAAERRAAAEELRRRAEEASAAAALEAASAVSAAVRKGQQALRDASRSRVSEERAEQRKRREEEEAAAEEKAAAEAEAARAALLASQGPWKPRVGESVFVKKLSARGTVSSVHDGGRVVGVKLGGGAMSMTTKVSVDDVERVDESSPSPPKKNKGKTFKARMTSKWSKKV